jgi:cytochrome c-type biogenesis protein CcmH
MSPRDSFWFLAGVLVAVAIMVAVRAWLRGRSALGETPAKGEARRPPIPAFAVPVAAGLALVGVALGIYFLLGSPDSIASAHPATGAQPSHEAQMGQQPSPTAGSLDDVTNKLAARLATQGGSDNDWQLLAESYEYMGRAAEAKAARAHITSGAPVAAASGDAAAGQATSDQIADIADAFDKPQLVRVANAPSPHPGTPSDNMAGATVDQTAANAASTANNRPTAPSNGPNGARAVGSAEISGTVEITSKLARQAKSGTTLFIYAKQPNAPGPPLAVLRVRAGHWPVSFTLNDGNAMVPGRNLSNANTVQIEARISKHGDALPQTGDLVGTVTSVNPRDGHPVKISIDREIG